MMEKDSTSSSDSLGVVSPGKADSSVASVDGVVVDVMEETEVTWEEVSEGGADESETQDEVDEREALSG